jgi:hypothetical protein
MKIFDNEAETIINLTDVKDEDHLQRLFAEEDEGLTDVLFDTPFFGMSLKEYQDQYGPEDFEGLEERTCTYNEWMTECLKWAQECLEG